MIQTSAINYYISVTCWCRGLFGLVGESGSLRDSNVIICCYRNSGSVDMIAQPFSTTGSQISHSQVRVSCRSMDSG